VVVDLRSFRQNRRLTIEALAYLGDLDPSTVSLIERGLVVPHRATVVKMARGLGVSVGRMRGIIEASAEVFGGSAVG
jgi:transcriptional regulator with XRE-family HTH domain